MGFKTGVATGIMGTFAYALAMSVKYMVEEEFRRSGPLAMVKLKMLPGDPDSAGLWMREMLMVRATRRYNELRDEVAAKRKAEGKPERTAVDLMGDLFSKRDEKKVDLPNIPEDWLAGPMSGRRPASPSSTPQGRAAAKAAQELRKKRTDSTMRHPTGRGKPPEA